MKPATFETEKLGGGIVNDKSADNNRSEPGYVRVGKITGAPALLAAVRGKPVPVRATKENAQPSPPPSSPASSSIGRIGNSALFLLHEQLECPPLSDEDFAALDVDEPYLTKHIPTDLLERCAKGSFKFGSIQSYAPKDAALNAGRFSDHQEGLQRDVFSPQDPQIKNFKIGGISVSGVRVTGMSIAEVRLSIDDYCACLTLGKFDPDTAQALRVNGNPDLGAYVTYDLRKLKAAISALVQKDAEKSHLRLFGRKVVYGQKDRHLVVPTEFTHTEKRNPIETYVKTAFVKSQAYSHEQEYRLILTDPQRLAGLMPASPHSLFLEDTAIADAVIDSGTF